MRYTLVLCVIAAAFSGCMIQNSKQKLSTSLQKYNVALRWGATEWAAEHVAPESREALLGRRSEFDDIRVSGCTIGRVKLKGKDQAIATVHIEWYSGRTLSLRTSVIEQKWKLRSGKWLIVSQRLVKGAPCPLFLPSNPKVRISSLDGRKR